MRYSLSRRLISAVSSWSISVIAGLFLLVSLTQTANAISVSVSLSGTIGSPATFSAEPYIGAGDLYSGNLMFDVDAANTVSNVLGNVMVNGYASTFTGYVGIGGANPTATRFTFSISPFGDGAGGFNVDSVSLGLGAPGLSFSNSLFDIVTAPGNYLNSVNIIASKDNASGGMSFSNNFDSNPLGAIAVSAVPLPAGLPLYAAGLAVIGFVGWRKKQKNA